MTASDESGDPTVPIVCPECDTRTRVPLSSVGERVERHNSTRHDGEEVATVDPALREQLADLVADDLGWLGE
jgi:hypothetical protein